MDFRTKGFAVKAFTLTEPINLSAELSAVHQAIEAGQRPGEILRQNLAGPIDIATVLACRGLESNGGQGLPLQTGKPIDEQARPFLEASFWEKLLPGARQTAILNLSAGLLQIYDFWEESHAAAQRADDLGEHRLSAQWHAICHRREPDAGNANYWWARVGKNPLADALTNLIDKSMADQPPCIQTLASRLLERGQYSDRAMVSQSLAVKPLSDEAKFLRLIQKFEMLLLFDLTLDQLT